VINLVCDRALMAGFSNRVREITPTLVTSAVRNLEGGRQGRNRYVRMWSPAGGLRRATLVVGSAVLLFAAGGAAVYWGGFSRGSLGAGAQAKPPKSIAAAPAALSPAATSPPATPSPPAAPSPSATPSPPVAPTAAQPSVPAAPRALTPGAPPPPDRPVVSSAAEAQRHLMTRLLSLWGIQDAVPGAVPPWPTNPDGSLDISGVANRYQLSATFLPETTLADLRAIGLPALVELSDAPAGRPYLLRWIGADTATLVAPSGEEARFALNTLDPAWTRSAWIVWRNVDQLPLDPSRDLTPTVLTTIGLRLQKLGYLNPPVPPSYDSRFQLAVRRFQRAVGGLHEDGIVGPRTVIALSRVVGGRFSPTIAEGGAQ
jgi:hypothetical protein